MNYFLDLFSPETYEAFSRSDRSVSGFRAHHNNAADRVRIGDKLICYMTRLSRWFGVLEVLEGPFRDSTPLFTEEADPFVVRFRVRPVVWLAVAKAVPIYEDAVWNHLSFTKGQTRGTPTWTGRVRTSLAQLSDADGRLLESLLLEQSRGGRDYPLDTADSRKLATHRPRVAAVKMTKGPAVLETFAASLRQEDVGAGVTRVTYRFNFSTRPRWLRAVVDPIAAALFRREVRQRLEALKHHLERPQ